MRRASVVPRMLLVVTALGCAPEPPPPEAPASVWPPEPVFVAIPAQEVAARALAVALPTVRGAVLRAATGGQNYRMELQQSFSDLRPAGDDRNLSMEYRWYRQAEAAAWAALAPLPSVTELCAQVPGIVRCPVPADSSGGECFDFVAPSGALVYGIAAVRDEEGRTVVSVVADVTDVDRCTRTLSHSLVLLDSGRDRALWRGIAERSVLQEARGWRINGCYLCTDVIPPEKRKP